MDFYETEKNMLHAFRQHPRLFPNNRCIQRKQKPLVSINLHRSGIRQQKFKLRNQKTPPQSLFKNIKTVRIYNKR